MVQVTGLEPTRLMRSLAPEASALCLRNKFRFHQIEDFVLWNKFRYHQIKDLVQFRHCCFKMYQQ